MLNKEISFFKKIIKPYSIRVFFCLLINLLMIFLNLLGPYIIKQIIDISIANKDLQSLYKNIFLLIALNILSQALSIINTLISTYVGERLLYDLRMELYQTVAHKNILFFNVKQLGDITNRILNELPDIITLFVGTPVKIITQAATFILTFFVMLSLNKYITLLILMLTPFIYIITKYFNPKFKVTNTKIMERYSKLNNVLYENIANVKVLQFLKTYNYGDKRLSQALHEYIKVKYEFLYINLKNNTLLSAIYNTPTIIIYLVGGYFAIIGHLSIGSIIAITAYISQIFAPISALTSVSNELQKSHAAFNRYYEIIQNEDNFQNKTLSLKYIQKGISVENITFCYPDNKNIINNFKLNIPVGYIVQFAGGNGCGKSTLIDLVCGILKPQNGYIKYDSYNLSNIDDKSLRKLIGVVSQNTFLFNDTIRNNIKMGRGIEDESILSLSKELGFSDIIDSENINLNTIITNNGGNISGGQRQKIAVLRALINGPQILVLDEVNAFLDKYSKVRLYEYIHRYKKDKIVLFVTHEILNELDPDIILNLDNIELSKTS